MALTPGTRIGPYEILALIGAGGMGRVYRARDSALGRDVAVKVLGEEVSSDPERLRRFKHEARSASALNHPNIVTVYDIDRHGDTPYIAMEFVEGRTLRQILNEGPLPAETLLRYATQIAGGLAKAHGAGIIHRDLKPENLMVTPDGYVKILDFGLAKLLPRLGGSDSGDATITRESTETGVVMGTPRYMSPEQASGKPLDARTDVFSMGVVLHEMATGHAHFHERQFGGSVESTFASETSTNVRPPEALDSVIQKCLAPDPDDRYASAKELEEDLRRLTVPASVPHSRLIRRRWRLWGFAAAVVVSGLTTAYWLGTSREGPGAGTGAHSIAVLPFVDMSREGDQEYFSDGLTEELINDLNKIPGLRVVGRTSCFQFKGKNEDLRAIGEKLSVTSLLEGSVRAEGTRLRITVQLVNAENGFHLWSETYDRELDDIFEVQTDIARAVAGALEVTLLEDEVPSSRTTTTEAYTAYLMGRYFYGRATKESLEKAVEYQKRAIQLDPEFARAWSGLAAARAYQAGIGYLPSDEGFDDARAAVERALSLNPNLAGAHAVLGWIQMSHDWDFAGADASYRKARSLQAGTGVVEGAQLALALGRSEEASELARKAAEDDPLSGQANFTLALTHYYSGRLEEAATQFKKLLEIQPQFPNVHALLGQIYLQQARPQEALAEVEQERERYWRLHATAVVAHAAGRPRDSDEALAQFIEEFQTVAALQVAEVYAYRGEQERAIEWLERAYDQRDGGLFLMRVDPLLKSLEGDERYRALLEKMRLPL